MASLQRVAEGLRYTRSHPLLLGTILVALDATVFTPRVSVLSGGILCVLGVGLLALALLQLRSHDNRLQEQTAGAPMEPVMQREH